MPIKVSCQCGTNLNVPDAAAGKNVKCPKCQKVIAVPGAQPKPAAGGKTAQPAKSAVGAKPPAAAKAPDALANLFESAGLKKREGTFCPACDRVLPPGLPFASDVVSTSKPGQRLKDLRWKPKSLGTNALLKPQR